MTPGAWLRLGALGLVATSGCAAPDPPDAGDQLHSSALRDARPRRADPVHPRGRRLHRRDAEHGRRPVEDPSQPPSSSGIPGIDSLQNFDRSFEAAGFAADGTAQSTWVMNIVGSPPEQGGTTHIRAPIVPVSVDLLDLDGSLRVVDGVPLHSDVTPFVEPTLRSPIFEPLPYGSSNQPTQFGDAIQRAQFFQRAKANWHTRLDPVVRPTRTLSIPFGSYQFALNDDGSCCLFIAVEFQVFDHLLFPQDPADVSSPIGAAESSGDMTTQDLTTLLLPDTYLYTNTRANCCIIGFHSYDLEPGDAVNGNRERRFVVAVATWISPGRISGVEDISGLSHEVIEAINDPFVGTDGVHNITPWWRDPLGTCQNKNEIGDVVQGIAGAVFPTATPGRTYHLQNQALLPWFRAGQPSDAIDGAFSYPDETLLTAPAPVLPAHCQ